MSFTPSLVSRDHPLSNGDVIACHDPGTLEKLGEVRAYSRSDVEGCVARARVAQEAWGRTSFEERRRVVRGLLDEIVANQDLLARVCVRDSGKTMVDAAMGEIFPVCEKLRYILAEGERDLRAEPRNSGLFVHKKVRVEYRPFGVIGVICPWNFPFHNVFCPVVPALFAGNAVVAKVSEWTSWSAAEFQTIFTRVLERFGHSRDLVQLITGAGDTGRALVQTTDKVFFTGSPQNGRKVMSAASDTLTPVVLELGGKDAMIVCDDADVEFAAGTAMLGVFTACGQMCVAAERLYVFDAVYEKFLAAVESRVRGLRQGPASRDQGGQYDVGAMTMPAQLDLIQSHVDDAISKGARLITGGKRRNDLGGQFFEPTILADVTHTMRVAREETFGPVMTVLRVRTEEEAVRLANDSGYGLGSSVFTNDSRRAERMARRISAGMTVVNDYGIGYMMQSAPFGGVRSSGFGRINGREGLRGCCYEQTVVTDRFPVHQAFAFYPTKPETFPFFRDVVTMIYGDGLARRARAALGVLAKLPKIARS